MAANPPDHFLVGNRTDFHGHFNQGIQIGQLHFHADSVEDRCHQTFRLVHENGAGYEFYKDRIDPRVDGTCLWFLNHDNYTHWKRQRSGVLLVSADPGCGKSVLAKYLVDHDLPAGNILYFFFKDQDQDTLDKCLCAILHQLLTANPSLIKHALPRFAQNGENLKRLTKSLWDILLAVFKDADAGPWTIVLDALDECAPADLQGLTSRLEALFPRHSAQSERVKFLLTSRPYQSVIAEFRGLARRFPNIHIPGEDHSDEISREVNCVIRHRVGQLADRWDLKEPIKVHLERRLLNVRHRTYLWVYLVFDFIDHRFKQTERGIDELLATLPRTVDGAYEKLLSRCTYEQRVRKALMIIIAARRPLTLQEMNIAVEVEDTQASVKDLDLEGDREFQETLRNWCGLFVSVYNKKVYLIHQTAREFLLRYDAASDPQLDTWRWKASFSEEQAEALLASLCVTYLSFDEFRKPPESADSLDGHHFFLYCSRYWFRHSESAKASITSKTIEQACESLQASGPTWFPWAGVSETLLGREPPGFIGQTAATIACALGLIRLVEPLLNDPDARSSDGSTLLCLALSQKSAAMTQILLRKGANVELTDRFGDPPLDTAIFLKDAVLARMLLQQGADIYAQNMKGRTALQALHYRAHDTNRYIENHEGLDPLEKAERHPNGMDHDFEMFRILLDHGVGINEPITDSWSLLSLATSQNHKALAEDLIARGADVNNKSISGRTPLSVAAECGYTPICQVLLDHGASVDKKARKGSTPLLLAARSGYEASVRLLLEAGARIDVPADNGDTPIVAAAKAARNSVIQLLLDHSARSIKRSFEDAPTPPISTEHFDRQILRGLDAIGMDNGLNEETLRLLVENIKDINGPYLLHGKTLLRYSLLHLWPSSIPILLLQRGADVNAQNAYGRSALHDAMLAETDIKVVREMINRGALVNHRDTAGRTALHAAAVKNSVPHVNVLLENGAAVDIVDNDGRTPYELALKLNASHVAKALLHRHDLQSGSESKVLDQSRTSMDVNGIANEMGDMLSISPQKQK